MVKIVRLSNACRMPPSERYHARWGENRGTHFRFSGPESQPTKPKQNPKSPSQPWGTRPLHRHYPPPAGNAKSLTRLGSNPERRSAAVVQRRSKPGTNVVSSRERVSVTTEFINEGAESYWCGVLFYRVPDVCPRNDRAKGRASPVRVIREYGLHVYSQYICL